MRKTFRILRFLLGLVNLAALVALFVSKANPLFPKESPWGWLCGVEHLQFIPALMRFDLIALGILLALTVLFGRFYCEVICPLGVWQDVLRLLPRLGNVRRVCCRLPVTRVQWTVRGAVVLLALAAPWLFDPYAIFGRGVTGAEILLFALVSALAFVGRGRLWCNWICPVGTFFALTQLPRRKSATFTRFNSNCKNCKACWPSAAK